MTALFGPLIVVVMCTLASGCCPAGSRSARSVSSSSSGGERSSAGDDARGTVLRGEASYYANSLAGHRTANGERYDPAKYTAANRSLPLGTRLRVTRVSTGKSVVVRVNDRGPFGHRRRILDLSRAAAKELGIVSVGVAEVEATVLGSGD